MIGISTVFNFTNNTGSRIAAAQHLTLIHEDDPVLAEVLTMHQQLHDEVVDMATFAIMNQDDENN